MADASNLSAAAGASDSACCAGTPSACETSCNCSCNCASSHGSAVPGKAAQGATPEVSSGEHSPPSGLAEAAAGAAPKPAAGAAAALAAPSSPTGRSLSVSLLDALSRTATGTFATAGGAAAAATAAVPAPASGAPFALPAPAIAPAPAAITEPTTTAGSAPAGGSGTRSNSTSVSPPTSPGWHAVGSAPAEFKSRLHGMLEFNERFVADRAYEQFRRARMPPKRAVVVTCMDTRLTHLLPHALNLKDGDAKIIKTAGGIVTHPFGGIMRSIVVALFELNADEVFVIAHYGCGMSTINPQTTVEKMKASGITQETLRTLEFAGINVQKWLHGFDDVMQAVRNSVSVIANHPLVPNHIPVHGLIIDPTTGKLDLIVDGLADDVRGHKAVEPPENAMYGICSSS